MLGLIHRICHSIFCIVSLRLTRFHHHHLTLNFDSNICFLLQLQPGLSESVFDRSFPEAVVYQRRTCLVAAMAPASNNERRQTLPPTITSHGAVTLSIELLLHFADPSWLL